MSSKSEKSGGGAAAAPPGGGRQHRGFAAMSPEKQKEIASLGGKAAHAKGTAHEFTPSEARVAGRRGGQSNAKKRAALEEQVCAEAGLSLPPSS